MSRVVDVVRSYLNGLERSARSMSKDTSRVLSIRDPEHWRNRDDIAPTGPISPSHVLALSAAWACVNLVAGTIASLPLMVYRTDSNGSRTVAADHPLYRVLHDSPNSLQTALDFWEFMCGSLELWGNAFARKIVNNGRVVSLVPIMPELPSVVYGDNGQLRYKWTDNGKSYETTNDEVLHVRGFGGNPLGGMSTLSFGSRAFSLAAAIENSAGATFKNGLRPSGVLTFEKFVSPEQRDRLDKLLGEKFTGAMNAGRPMVLEGGSKWSQLGINPEDAQMLQSRAFSVEEICRFFGVPPFMIGHTDKQTSFGTGIEQQTLGFQKFTLRRRLKRIESAAEKQLLTPEDLNKGITIEFNVEGLLRGDSPGRAAFYTSMSQIGALTINEIRARENLPPVAGGDVPRMQAQNVPINEPRPQIPVVP